MMVEHDRYKKELIYKAEDSKYVNTKWLSSKNRSYSSVYYLTWLYSINDA